MSPLEKKIRQSIEVNGPMSIETFMGMAVSHYYATRDPFGAEGDFTTAPEISQMFGELIGLWIADTWIKLGQPSPFNLVEGGPGRGTLMADILRATKGVDGLHDAMNIHLMETSPKLRDLQRAMLEDYHVEWHASLDDLSNDPLIFIANELLDALPIRQYQSFEGKWFERVIGIEDDKLVFGLTESTLNLPPVEGAIKEISPASIHFMAQLSLKIRDCKGAALLIDYGYDEAVTGDTLQAVKEHGFAPVLEDIGNADLTALVDFVMMAKVSQVPVKGPINQGAFLRNLGIQMRFDKLKANATPQQVMELQSGMVRLIADDQMGVLFKVLGLCHDPAIELAGFYI